MLEGQPSPAYDAGPGEPLGVRLDGTLRQPPFEVRPAKRTIRPDMRT